MGEYARSAEIENALWEKYYERRKEEDRLAKEEKERAKKRS